MPINHIPRYERLFNYLRDRKSPATALALAGAIRTTTPSKCIHELKQHIGRGRFMEWELVEGAFAWEGKMLKTWSVRRVGE